MTSPRPHPFALVFGELADERFPALAEQVGDAPSVEQFVMAGPVVELLRDLRPDGGLGDAVDDFVSFVHASYCFWAAGARTLTLGADATRELLGSAAGAVTAPAPHAAQYIQLAPRLVWCRLEEHDRHEPLDGWFAIPGGDRLRMVACLGVHHARPGLSVLTVEGPPPESLVRADGSPTFAPVMEGGDTAGLASAATAEELLALGWTVASREGA